MKILLLLLYIQTIGSDVVKAASDGAKLSACVDMYPAHAAQAQDREAPYEIHLSSASYGDSENISVTLKANTLEGFKGFLCQARRELRTPTTYGVLFPSGLVPMTNNCEQNASLTHTEPSMKSSAEFIWSPPPFNAGTIYIVCTVVKEFRIFWTNITSQNILYLSTTSPLDASTDATTSKSPQETSTNVTSKVTAASTALITTQEKTHISNRSTTSLSTDLVKSTVKCPWVTTRRSDITIDSDNDYCNKGDNIRLIIFNICLGVTAWIIVTLSL